MLLLRTFARKLRDDAIRDFSLNANTIPVGGWLPISESRGLRRNDLSKALPFSCIELGHDRGGGRSWAKISPLIFSSSGDEQQCGVSCSAGILLLYFKRCRELPDPLVVPCDPQVYKCSG